MSKIIKRRSLSGTVEKCYRLTFKIIFKRNVHNSSHNTTKNIILGFFFSKDGFQTEFNHVQSETETKTKSIIERYLCLKNAISLMIIYSYY